MPEKAPVNKRGFSADWLLRGLLTKLGDTLDNATGRKWTPSSSLAASVLITRIKKLLDAESRDIPGKGKVVPHNIKLKMQWNKFAEDAEEALKALEVELLAAAVDHINDSLYYTYAPVVLEVKPDYFIEGVKLSVSFEEFDAAETGVEMNVTVPAINVAGILGDVEEARGQTETYLFHFEINGRAKEKSVDLTRGKPQAVGRTAANAIVLEDDSVSKTHASFVIGADGSLSVADTGSTNGTFINGERIAYGKAVRLAEGDTVRFGSVDVTFEKQPRFEPAQPETDVDAGEAVTIGGFEFRSRPTPEEEQAEASADTPSTPAKSEPIPDETLKMDDDRTLKMPANADEDQPGEKK